jgi:CubicO group peptidase (beta-lactamase class C family)
MEIEASSSRTGHLRAVSDRLFRTCVGSESPGAVVAVTRDGCEILRACYGMADIANGVPLDARSVIRIGSQTKQFAVLLTLMLAAEGKLSLDEEVNRYLPWLPKYPAPATLRHVATNTSGLREFLEVMALAGIPITSESSRETARRIIAHHSDFNFLPGDAMIYCNTGFFLLSEIIEEVSGRTFNELLAERITGPLGMAGTRLMPRDSQILPRLAVHHTRGPDGGWHRAHWGVVLGGEGGMVSTLEDMLIWQTNLEHPKVRTAEMYRVMATPSVYRNGTTALYGMGLVSAPYRGLACVGHGGSVAGGRSQSMRFPNEGLGIVILGNRDDIAPFSLARRIADAELGAEMTNARNDADWRRLVAAAGMYRHEGGDDLFEIAIQEGEPLFVTNMGSAVIEQIGPNRFAPERHTMHIIFSPVGGEAMDVTFCGERRHYRRVDSSPSPNPHPIAGRWRHAGAGISAEIAPEGHGHTLRLTSEFGVLSLYLAHLDGDLFIARPANGDSPLRPWTCTMRAMGDAIVFSSDRIKGLRFAKA